MDILLSLSLEVDFSDLFCQACVKFKTSEFVKAKIYNLIVGPKDYQTLVIALCFASPE